VALINGQLPMEYSSPQSLYKRGSRPLWFHHVDMLLGAFVAYMVGGTFLDVAYFDLFYQLVAVVIVSKEYIKQQDG
jgi:hypothetical protein